MKATTGAACAVLFLCATGAYALDDMLPEVRVTSTTIDDRFEAKRGEASNVANISGRQVDERHGKNVMDVLSSVPGVTAELQSGDSIKIMLRGVEAQRYMGEKPGVAIVIDGVPVLERTGRVNLDLDNIDSIKVIKGGASYLFGEDALSGAIIITTKRGAKMAGVTLGGELGSFGYRKTLARVGTAQERWNGHVQLTSAHAPDFYDQGDYGRKYLDGKVQFMLTEVSDLTFGFEHARRDKDSHGSVAGFTNAINDPRSVNGGKDFARKYDITLDKYNLTYAHDLGGSNLLVSTYLYKDHTYGWQVPSGFLRDSAGNLIAGVNNMSLLRDVYATGRDTQQQQKGVKSEWRRDGEAVGVLTGLDLQRFEDRAVTSNLVTYSSRNTPIGVSNPLNLAGAVTENMLMHTDTRAVYGEAKWQVGGPWVLTANGRYDSIGISYESFIPLTPAQIAAGKIATASKSFTAFSPRLGVNYALAGQAEVYSNISTGFRIPTANQIYGSTLSPTGSVLPNPDLKPEKAWNYEIGVRGKQDMLNTLWDYDLALFQIDRKDFILNTGGQYGTTPTTAGIEQYQNIGGVRNRGLEASLKSNPAETLSWDIAYTYLNAVFTNYHDFWLALGSFSAPLPSVHYDNTGKAVPRTPKHRLNLAAKYRAMDGLLLTGEMKTQSDYFGDEVNIVHVGGHTLFNLMANYDLKRGEKSKVSLFARVDNIFDRFFFRQVRSSRDSNGDGIYNQEDPSIIVDPGRNWTLGVSATF